MDLSVPADRREPRAGGLRGRVPGRDGARGDGRGLLAIPVVAAVIAGCTYLLAHAGFGRA